MLKWLHSLKRQQPEGQGLVEYAQQGQDHDDHEYALILVLVAVVVIVILALLGPAIGNIFSNIVAGIGGFAPQTGGWILFL